MTFRGLLTALATPFAEGAVDEACYRALVRRQIEGGVDGLVPVGTTGEAPTLPVPEHIDVVRWTVEEAGDVPVLAGIGSNSTATAIHTAKAVEEVGARGVLATVPYYNKPTQEGLFQHFRAIAESVGVEVCLYDVPGRSIIRLQPDTIARLAEIPNITCVKDATADMAQVTEVRRRLGDRLTLLSGDDFTVLPFIACGGHGTISVASNVVPAKMKALVDASLAGDLDEARRLNDALYPLFHALFLQSNPIPLKAAMARMGLMNEDMRLPMTPMSDVHRPALYQALASLGLEGPAQS